MFDETAAWSQSASETTEYSIGMSCGATGLVNNMWYRSVPAEAPLFSKKSRNNEWVTLLHSTADCFRPVSVLHIWERLSYSIGHQLSLCHHFTAAQFPLVDHWWIVFWIASYCFICSNWSYTKGPSWCVSAVEAMFSANGYLWCPWPDVALTSSSVVS